MSTLNEVLQTASEAWVNVGLAPLPFDPNRLTPRRLVLTEDANFDALGKFVVCELHETWDGDVLNSMRKLERAMDDIEAVIRALHRLSLPTVERDGSAPLG